METKNKGGRPPGKDYPVARTMLLAESDLADMQRIAATWNVSMAEVVRRLIRKEARVLDRAERRKRQEADARAAGGAVIPEGRDEQRPSALQALSLS